MLILEYVFSVRSLCQLHFVMSQWVSFPYLNLTIQGKHYEHKPRSYYNVSVFQRESRIIYIKTARNIKNEIPVFILLIFCRFIHFIFKRGFNKIGFCFM